MLHPPPNPGPDPTAARFFTTHWSLVVRAGQAESQESRQALEELCRNYWQPLYACVRRMGHDPDAAKDLTQDFFTYFLKEEKFGRATPERGRFRSYLLTSLKHFVTSDWRKHNALKRGGEVIFVSRDDDTAEHRYQLEPSSDLTPEKLFERRWAVTLLERAHAQLKEEYVGGREHEFEALAPFLSGDTAAGDPERAAGALKQSIQTFRVTAHRMRKRYRKLIEDEVARTVVTGSDLQEEMRCLFAALCQ